MLPLNFNLHNRHTIITKAAQKIADTPRKMRKAVAVLCAVAVVGVSMPVISMSVGAQTDINASSTDYLNLRSGAGTNYSVIKVLNKNTSVTVVDKSNKNWIKVKLSDGTTGYCSADYLNITTDARTTTSLNLRKGAGTSYAVIKTLDSGVKLDIIRFYGDSWAQVKLSDGTTGYVATNYISYISAAGSTTSAGTTSATVKFTLSSTSKTLLVGKKFTLTASTNSGGTIKWTTSNKNIATVTSKGVVTAVKAGTATITATDSKTSNKLTCKVTVVSSTISSITLTKKSVTLTAGETYYADSTITPSSCKVSYKTSNKTVATVSSTGAVKAIKAGTANVTLYDPVGTASSALKVTVKENPKVTISKTSASVNIGNSCKLTATASDNSTIKWSSSNTNVAAVRSGVVSTLKAGTATITATNAAGTVKATCKITVKSVSSSGVSLSRTSGSVTAGKTLYIKGSSTRKATWSSSNTAVATVSNGFILGKNSGKAAISYTDTSGNRKVCVVTVSAAAPVKFTYSSPNSATVNSTVTLVAITDKKRTGVKFEININGKKTTVTANKKTTDGSTYVWTGTYKVTSAGTFSYTAYATTGTTWQTCDDGKADIYVTSKKNQSTTAVERLRASDGLISFIGEKEGFVSSIYYDTLANNIPTLGYGYVVWEGQTFYNNLTKKEAYALLVSAVNKDVYAQKVNDLLVNNNVKFNQQQFDALVSFSYNLGTGWTSSSDLRTILLSSYSNETTSSTDSKVIGTVKAVGGLNLRSGSTTSSNVITVLANGEQVTLVSTQKYNSVWYKVKTSSGKTGYCSGTYLTLSTTGSKVRDLNYVNKNSLIKEMLAYHHAGGVCYYGLLYRRVDELEMFLYNDYVSDGRSNSHKFPSPSCISF